MINPFEKTEYQSGIDLIVKSGSKPSKYSATSAVNHIEKALKIRDIDFEMCAFRLITAEEEAATAIFLAMKHKEYTNSDKLKHRDHIYKNSVIPFLEAISRVFNKEIRSEMKPRLEFDEKDGVIKLSVIRIISGEACRVKAIPPLNFTIGVGNDKLHYEKELQELVSLKNKKFISEYLKERANIRNLLLYAGPTGLGSIPTLENETIINRINQIYLLLSIYLMIDQNIEKQLFVQDCLNAFLEIMGKIKK